ncbi:MAG: hypothetical protein AB1744_06400, partial [Candidatus Zixiibacteriota bacterium]
MQGLTGRITVLCFCALMFLATSAAAGTYVSLKGEFYITYPDEWAEVDYRVVDIFLAQGRSDSALPIYETVIAPKSAPHFFSEDYCILTVDTLGDLNDGQIDSVLKAYGLSFDALIEERPFAEVIRDPDLNVHYYD